MYLFSLVDPLPCVLVINAGFWLFFLTPSTSFAVFLCAFSMMVFMHLNVVTFLLRFFYFQCCLLPLLNFKHLLIYTFFSLSVLYLVLGFFFSFSFIVVFTRQWSLAMSDPQYILVFRMNDANFLLMSVWSICFLVLQSGDTHLSLWIVSCGKRMPVILRHIHVTKIAKPLAVLIPFSYNGATHYLVVWLWVVTSCLNSNLWPIRRG